MYSINPEGDKNLPR